MPKKKKKVSKKRKGSNPSAAAPLYKREYVNPSPSDLTPGAIAGYVEGAPDEVVVDAHESQNKNSIAPKAPKAGKLS